MNAALAPETGALHFKYKTVTLRGLLARFLKRYRMQANTNTRSNPMACEEAGTTYSPIIVWTRKNDTDWVFHPVGVPVDANGFQLVRPSIELSQSSGALIVRPAVRTSNDGSSWDTPVAIGSQTRSSNGITYGSAFEDMTSTTNAKQLVQPGIESKNTTGTSLEMGLATLKLDHRRA